MSAKKPYISVVIPTYNRAGFLGSSIESVLNQKDIKWPIEIIVVDDGSTDDTEIVLKPYKNKVRYFKIPHSGLPAVARNYGISKAKGELIAFQDSDDIWPLDKLSSQVPLLADSSTVLVYGQAEVMDQHGKKTGEKYIKPGKIINAESFQGLLKENVISTLTVIARKDAILSVGGFNELESVRAVEDYELWLRLSATNPKGLKSMNKTLAFYRSHDKNISKADAILAINRLLAVYYSLWDNTSFSNQQRLNLEKQIEVMEENWSRQQNIEGSTPAISVVMGIYKDRAHVREAVRSILGQTHKDFEFIIIDDGSTDGSASIVSGLKDSRIRLIRQTNHGLVAVLNKGVRLARAEFIARMDADDIALPDRFKKELEWILADPKRAVVSTFFRYVNHKTLEPTGITITSVTQHIDIARHMYFDNPIGHGAALIRKKAIVELGGYSDKYGPNEDYDLWRRIVAAGWQVGLIPEVHYLYRLSPGGISSTNKKEQHSFFTKLVKDIWLGPIYAKPFWRIIADARYYKHIDSPFKDKVYRQYKSHQVRLTFEFLIHGQLLNGYNNFVGALLLYPTGAIRLWKTLLWAPIKYLREHRS